MNSTKGWYCKLQLPKEGPQTRWVKVENFMLLFYQNKADTDPEKLFHVDGLKLADALQEIDQFHSFKAMVSHACSISFFYVYTPNQFDAQAIQAAIIQAQNEWKNIKNPSYKPSDPNGSTFSVDIIGKFIYRPADRLDLTILPNQVVIKGKNMKDKIMNIDHNFDCHPSNYEANSSKDQKWITFKYMDQTEQIYEVHCDSVEKMLSLISLVFNYLQ